MTGAVLLITDFLFGGATVTVTVALVALLFTTIWFVAPLIRRAQNTKSS